MMFVHLPHSDIYINLNYITTVIHRKYKIDGDYIDKLIVNLKNNEEVIIKDEEDTRHFRETIAKYNSIKA